MDNTKFLNISWSEIKSSLATGILMALLVVLIEIKNVGSIFNLNWKSLLDAGVMAFITFAISSFQSIMTTQSGKLFGLIKIK